MADNKLLADEYDESEELDPLNFSACSDHY